MDAWDGYPASRDRVTQGWVDAGVRNPVVLTGDVHAHWASDDYTDCDDPAPPSSAPSCLPARSPPAGTATTSRPAQHPWAAWNPNLQLLDQPARLRLHDDHARRVTADFRCVPGVTRPGGEGFTRAQFVVDDGVRGLRQSADNPLPTARADRSLRAPRSDAAIIADTIEAETGH